MEETAPASIRKRPRERFHDVLYLSDNSLIVYHLMLTRSDAVD